MLIFFKKDNGLPCYLAGIDEFGYFVTTSKYDECLHFNSIEYDLLFKLRQSGFFPSWDLD